MSLRREPTGRRHHGTDGAGAAAVVAGAGGGFTGRPARRMLVESAWSYRFPVRQTMRLKRKAKHASEEAKVIAWRAQKRLCGRYRTLLQAVIVKVTVASMG